MTLTEDTDVTIYRATMETDVVPSTGIDLGDYEEELFLNLPSSRDDGVTSASVNTTNEVGIDNDETARLNGADASRRIGPAKLLAVSPGDQINVSVNSYHTGFTGTQSPESQANIINALASAFGGSASSALGTESRSIYEFFNTNAALAYVGANGSSSKPRAYLNVLLFDQDFNPVSGQSGFLQTDQASGYKTLNISKSIGQGGYVYVYLSNEGQTGFDVYFDDLSITHTKGAILQEDHYYPFGANISALSSTAPLSKPNQFKFGGKELQTEFNLGWYDYEARTYDSQLGRFLQVDPLGDQRDWLNPYNYVQNNPMLRIDPNGQIDDFFDEDGNYLGTDESTTDVVRVVSKNEWEKNKKVDDNGNVSIDYASVLESSEELTKTKLGENAIVSIVSFYNDQLSSADKTDRSFEFTTEKDKGSIAMSAVENFYTGLKLFKKDPTMNINVRDGRVHWSMGTASNIKNILVHEHHHLKNPSDDPVAKQELAAIEVQQGHSTYGGTTVDFRNGIDSYKQSMEKEVIKKK